MKKRTEVAVREWLMMLAYAALILAVCAGFGTCKKWQYDECVAVGHGAAFCAADTAGCFSGGKGRRSP